ncbi:hypothetical protein Pan216_33650 [Planctomycetes bacterium Pan216]|uniref:Sialate O-acetylesterase domain-containing protein n=1 Tax=Kolteria novifilia TaxID=2527975 RepID=A0A518B695_9BACT|nr:hypothetical protein Pan216_33650 [Planctomycetes bacterium Pan216]
MIRKSKLPALALVAVALLSQSAALADIKTPAIISDRMVLEQGRPVTIWGTADEGETVTVSFQGQEKAAKATGGRWTVTLDPLVAGGPETMTIKGKNKLVIRDVLVGTVWVCSGQSNMEWPLRSTEGAETAISKANNPNLRYFKVKRTALDAPADDVEGEWVNATPENAPGFSAVGYYFGHDLQRALGIPVGLIEASWGGTPAEAWVSKEAIDARHRDIASAYAKALEAYPKAKARYDKAYEQWKKDVAAREKDPKLPMPRKPYLPMGPENPRRPSALYNGMIAPLIPYTIQGVIWYQGESNAGRAFEYKKLFPNLINDWRTQWKQGDFPFLFVQLAPFQKKSSKPTESGWAELREAQRLTSIKVPNTAMAVTTDVGDENDVHPRMKQPVGSRLALAARKLAYGEKIPHTGPTFKSVEIRGDTATITFENTAGGLVAKDGPLKGFSVAGADRVFHNADAKIVGDSVEVSSKEVPHPTAVRYGWASYPDVNLWNKAGLPASPFRTDDFPWITQPNGKHTPPPPSKTPAKSK